MSRARFTAALQAVVYTFPLGTDEVRATVARASEVLRGLANECHVMANELDRAELERQGRIPFGFVRVDHAGLDACGCGKPSAHPSRMCSAPGCGFRAGHPGPHEGGGAP